MAGNRGPSVQPPLLATWRCMERLVDARLAAAIGVANFSTRKLRALLTAPRCKPVSVVQAECHPYWLNSALIQECLAHGVHFTAYSALGSRGAAGVPGGHAAGGPELLDSRVVGEIARTTHHSPAQVLLRWALQARPACSALFKSESPEHIRSDAELQTWRLCDANAEAVSVAGVVDGVRRRYCSGDIFLAPAEGPYRTLRDLWDDDGTGEAEEEAIDAALRSKEAHHLLPPHPGEAPPTPTAAPRVTPP